MYRLKLIKGKTYWGAGVKASQEKPIVEVKTKDHAERLLKSGHFAFFDFGEEVKAPEAPSETKEDSLFADEEEVEEEPGNPDLDELKAKKKDELVDYAAECGIDITGCKTKEDIFNRIVEAQERAAAVRDAIRSEV